MSATKSRSLGVSLTSEVALDVCAVCQKGEIERGTTTATFEVEGTTVVIANVPADICTACGEGSFDALTTERLLELAAEAAGWTGAPVQICNYTAS